ncbi:MAG TPA: alanine racemase [Bacteriovoracaceae bacterium]|nr:alanine racemase [Bacteriovoracaceae bacterium]
MRHSSFLEVNLDYLGGNFQKIQALAPACSILPMVKADAYGNGLIPITRFLHQEFKVSKFGCATLGEALEIIQQLPDFNSEILVFSEVELEDEKLRRAYLDYKITPVIHRRSDLEIILDSPDLKSVPLVLKVDTGMNRLGLSLKEIAEFAPRLKARGVEHLMTHFSGAYYHLKEGDKSNRQYAEFLKAKQILSDANVEIRETSVANSGAIEQGFGIKETHVRPGLMLYGPSSFEPRIWEGKQISRLVTRVLKTFLVKKGTPVGYGIHVTSEDTFMVVLPLGYGDGIMTFASGIELKINGYKARVFGRVNMDMTFLAFDPSVEGKIKQGDIVEIWNHDNRTITDIATQMKTHAYQVMCGISGRIPRIYKVK